LRGIVLAGGSGTRLAPMTSAVGKQLLPVYDKPMIYYPLSTLMAAGCAREILVISTPEDLPRFERLLGDGGRWGCRFEFVEQARPEGLAQAFVIGEEFAAGERVALVLGDNIFFGTQLRERLRAAAGADAATVFAYHVSDPERYGVIEFDGDRPRRSSRSRPTPSRTTRVPGLYFFPGDVAEVARRVRKSDRGEYEITEVDRALPRGRAAHRGDPGPRHRLARHRHVRVADAGRAVRAGR